MKKIIAFAFCIITILSASAQKIEVKESNESIGDGKHNALVVTLNNISPSDAEDAFRSFMKQYDGKRSSKDGGIFIDNATIKDIGNNTIDIYGKALGKKDDKEIKFAVAFDLGGAFLNSSDHKDQYKAAEKIVKEFAVKTTRDAIEELLKEAKRSQEKLEDAQKDLEKENRNLNEDIESYKSKIKKAEDDIVKNKSDQDKKKVEFDAQKKVVDDISKKLNSVE